MLQQELMARPRQIAQEIASIARHLLGHNIEVIWFGSWAKGTAKPHADIDIAIGGPCIIPPERFAELRDRIEEMATLHEIDLVDLRTVGDTFKQEILRHGIRL